MLSQFSTENQLVSTILEIRENISSRNTPVPDWYPGDPKLFFAENKFVICGSVSRSEMRVLANNANVIAIVDDYFVGKSNLIFNIPVITSDQWVRLVRGDKSILSVVLTPGWRAFNHFTKLAWQFNLKIIDPLQFIRLINYCNINKKGETGRFFWYGYEFYERTIQNLDRLLTIGKALDDAYSRFTWYNIILYRITLNPFYLESCAVGHLGNNFCLNSYSTNGEFFQLSSDEVYVDGGAFTGDTIEYFLRAVNGDFKCIHSFEPSIDQNKKIRGRLANLQNDYKQSLSKNIILHEKGLWDRETLLNFNPNQVIDSFNINVPIETQSAHLIESEILGHIYTSEDESRGSFLVPVTTIDNATNAEGTFIKLEIEGSELKALNGAKSTIERNRPKMAISAYHKPEDTETLYDFIMATGKNYKVGFRQHNPLCPDAMVFYCY